MPGRPHLRRLSCCLAGTVLALTACSGGELSVAGWEQPAEAVEPCTAIHDEAPAQVAAQDQRDVADDQALAWGDPAIILRCGIAEPEALEPTSQCHQIGRIGWFAETRPGSQLFTTIGREFSISVEVPDAYEPAADALLDLEPVIVDHNAEVDPCV